MNRTHLVAAAGVAWPVCEQGPLAPLCEQLRQLVVGVGAALEAAGAPSLRAAVLEQLQGDRWGCACCWAVCSSRCGEDIH